MNQLLEAAQFLGVSFIVVHPVLVCSPSNRHQGEVEVAGCQEQSLKRVARLAGERGIRVALENLQRKTAPAFADVRALVELARRLGEDNVGICLDTGHCLVSGLDPLQELDHGVSQLCSFHLHDNDGVEDLHWVPGKGPIDWPRFFDKLRAARYDGSFVLEIWGGKNAEDIMKEARAFAERYDLMGTS